VIYRGRKIDLALERVRLVSGEWVEREVVVHRGAVALLAEVDADHLCLVRNERYAVGRTLLEVPAGTIDEGESPHQTAVRELREETGYQAGSVELLGAWWVSPGVMSERMYLYRCRELEPGETNHQGDERLEPMVVEWWEALRMVEDGRIDDAKSMLAVIIGGRLRAK
jgi:ADP-ribose pyrophosphatase